jgi:hypothetical protein
MLTVTPGAIIGLLYYLHDQSFNKWPPGLTIITVLSKVASGALILPISEAIGQLKWTWFHGKKSRDAFDFEIFDKASRGAWGSFMLLCRTKGKSLAALGALLTVLLLAIDTFFQQVTDLPERWKLQGDSFIPRIIRYEPKVEYLYDTSFMDNEPSSIVNSDLKTALSSFFYDKNGTFPLKIGNATQAEIPLVCPTSRCEWPPYETLAVCSACEDVSHLLDYACLNMSMDWIKNSSYLTGAGTKNPYPNGKCVFLSICTQLRPYEVSPVWSSVFSGYLLIRPSTGTACGYFLNATSEKPVLMSGFRVENGSDSLHGETLLMRTLPLVTNPSRHSLYGGTINFRHVQYPILDTLIVSAADGTVDSVYAKTPPVAQECMLSWCVETLRSSYASGDYKEQVIETFINTTSADWPWWTQDYPEQQMTDTEFRANISIIPSSTESGSIPFGVSNETFLDLVIIFDEIFPSLITVANATAPQFVKIRTAAVDNVYSRLVHFSPWLAPNNVTFHMQRMARTMTNVIRSDTNSNELVVGIAQALETYVAVHWAWLTFPLVMLFLSIIFLVATMLKTSRNSHGDIGTWKTSAMPTLMYGLPQDMQKDIISTTSSGGLSHERPRKVRIRLLPKQGWRVSGQVDLAPRAPSGFI